MKKQFLFLVMILLPKVASAHDIEVQNGDGVTIYYNYTNDGKELQVTFRGTSYNQYSKEYTGHVVIPDEVTYMNRTRKVTNIEEKAFRGCSSLSSVTIGNSVLSIGNSTFYNCKGLTSVTIGNSVLSIGDGAFEGCSGLTTVTIPNSVASIGNWAFEGCSSLQKVIVFDIAAWCGISFSHYIHSNPLDLAHHIYSDENTEIKDLIIPNSVTSVGNYVFYGCSSLTSVTIPNSVTSIGASAFRECSGFTSVDIPNSVTSIGDLAFSGCGKLTSVTIPNSVTSIGFEAFYQCSGLTSVTIPNSVTSIGGGAFKGYDIPTVISQIKNPFTIEGKTSNDRVFTLNTFNNATLYVPKGTIERYKATDGWKDFAYIEEETGGSVIPPTPETCEKPTISYQNGKLTFICATEGANCHYSIKNNDIQAGSGNEVQLGVTYNISVYASMAGCENSETATATLCWIDAAPQTEGVETGLANIKANAVLMQFSDGTLNVQGVEDGTQVTVFNIDGKISGSGISREGSASVSTSLTSGTPAIVRIGNKNIKVIVK